MLIRVFRAVVQDGKLGELKSFLEETALPLVQRQDGLIKVFVGLPERENSPNEFSIITIWRDKKALKAFSGDEWSCRRG